MEKVIVEVSYTGGNYSAYLPELLGVVTVGDNIPEIEKNIAEAVEFHLQGMREDGDPVPEVFNGDFEYEFKLSTEAFLHAYKGVFTKAALSRITGIAERQLWRYEEGIQKPRATQRARIERGVHELAKQLLSITL